MPKRLGRTSKRVHAGPFYAGPTIVDPLILGRVSLSGCFTAIEQAIRTPTLDCNVTFHANVHLLQSPLTRILFLSWDIAISRSSFGLRVSNGVSSLASLFPTSWPEPTGVSTIICFRPLVYMVKDEQYVTREDVIGESRLVAWNPTQVWTFRTVIFATGDTRSRPMWTEIRPTSAESIPPYCINDLDLHRWFPSTVNTTMISHVPGTSFKLKNPFWVFTVRDPVRSLANACVGRMFDLLWYGNIVVVKGGCRSSCRALQMTSGDLRLVDTIIGFTLSQAAKLVIAGGRGVPYLHRTFPMIYACVLVM
ncbi:hypothetical protein BV22DRAFT_1045644 [Leucogyrophana mollusca]|uniref:Uncharacterized protein n=1 Tax=Leucogyrophana mollusca TaxID=85980 RepID=A0ACB8BPC6_9AGAM|nr:hypothetical protein BV22DRAFT_1045644 [Leucogyrophana mollusca]